MNEYIDSKTTSSSYCCRRISRSDPTQPSRPLIHPFLRYHDRQLAAFIRLLYCQFRVFRIEVRCRRGFINVWRQRSCARSCPVGRDAWRVRSRNNWAEAAVVNAVRRCDANFLKTGGQQLRQSMSSRSCPQNLAVHLELETVVGPTAALLAPSTVGDHLQHGGNDASHPHCLFIC